MRCASYLDSSQPALHATDLGRNAERDFSEGSHLAVDYLGPALAPGARKAVALFTGLLIALYSAVVVIWGVRLMMIGFVQTSPAMQVNMGLVYLVFPIAGGLMLLESILVTLGRARNAEGS